jgi:hypothetical protein
MKHKNCTNTRKQNTKQTNKTKQYGRKRSIKKSTGAEALNPEKTQII